MIMAGKNYLFEGKSGIEIGNEFSGLECLSSLMEAVYYAKFAHFNNLLIFVGLQVIKHSLLKNLQ